jgi:hypothetical protein
MMYNWSVDLNRFNKNSRQFIIWKLNQQINFGLNNQKLDLKLVKRYWKQLNLDPKRKKFLKLLLWPKLF